jgi:hypothetical protein
MAHNGVSVFGGVGERTREGNDLWNEFKESGVLDKQLIEAVVPGFHVNVHNLPHHDIKFVRPLYHDS